MEDRKICGLPFKGSLSSAVQTEHLHVPVALPPKSEPEKGETTMAPDGESQGTQARSLPSVLPWAHMDSNTSPFASSSAFELAGDPNTKTVPCRTLHKLVQVPSSKTMLQAAYPGQSVPVLPQPYERPHRLLSGSLRRGKWTPEEEEYVAAIIRHFISGVLPLQYGTTLRRHVAKLLHCDPMRVSKKLLPGTVFGGVRIDPKLGRRSYYPLPIDTPGLQEHKERAERELSLVRRGFIESIEREEREQQMKQSPSTSKSSPSAQTLSPLKRKRGVFEDKYGGMRSSDCKHDSMPRPRLPSLSELVRHRQLPLAVLTSGLNRSTHLQYPCPTISERPQVHSGRTFACYVHDDIDRRYSSLPPLRIIPVAP